MKTFDCAVIVPVFNGEAFLAETLHGIRAQRLPPSQIIVVDDGSTDASAEIARSFGDDIVVMQQSNSGQGVARDLGIASTDCEWIALCDSDDVWTEDHLARREELLARFPEAQFSFSDCYNFGSSANFEGGHLDAAPKNWFQRWCEDLEDGAFRVADPLGATLEYNPAYPSGFVFRRSAYATMGGFLERYSRWRAEDFEFTRRFYARCPDPIIGDRQQTWGYRRHDANHSFDQWRNLLARAQILEAHVKEGVEPEALRESALGEASNARGAAFDIAFWGGDFTAASALYRGELRSPQRTLRRRMRYLVSLLRRVSGTS